MAATPAEDHRVILRNRIFTPEPTLAPFLASRHRHGVL
jgi:hypothetical protein